MSGSGFLFDPNRCTGCSACSLACSTENDLGWGTSWRQVLPFNPERRPGIPSFHLSLACNHCTDAPCVAQCPTGAMRRDPLTGAVVVREDACIGCRYCAWVCPYDAPRFDEEQRVMTKCTLCNHRLRAGREPACVEACPTAALGFGALIGDDLLPGFPRHPAEPRIRFTPLRRTHPPESTWTLPADVAAAYGTLEGAPGQPSAAPRPRGRPLVPVELTLRGELPLLVFTLGMAGLVGWVVAALAGGVALPAGAFVSVAALLLAVSTFHLGRPSRAWRALANVRASRLSAEIAWVNAFLAAAVLWALSGGGAALGTAAAALGAAALWAADRVYDPVRTDGRVHSADLLLTGPTAAAALAGSPEAYGVLAALRATLYLRRSRDAGPWATLQAGLRVVGLALPVVAPILAPGAWHGWALLGFALGELLDRAAFYRSLAIPRPGLQLRRAVAAWSPAPGA